MSEDALVDFLAYVAGDPEARRLLDQVFIENRCNTEKCKKCVEAKVNYWLLKWLFGIRPSQLEVARDIHSCLGEQS